jgi:hypothetical protein
MRNKLCIGNLTLRQLKRKGKRNKEVKVSHRKWFGAR